MNTSNEITIGWPTNTRLAKDLEPLRDAMRLEETEPGVLKTRDFPGARFRELRSQDIASLLEERRFPTNLTLGVVGADVMTERRLQNETGKGEIWQNKTRRILEMGTPATELCVLVREEDVEQDQYLRPRSENEARVQKVISSYPNITEKCVINPFVYNNDCSFGDSIDYFRCNLAPAFPVGGGVESVLRNQDIPNILAAVDVVRSGTTAAKFGLKALGRPVLTSYPGLYQRSTNSRPENTARIEDFISFFRAALADTGIPELAPRVDPVFGNERDPIELFRFPRKPSC